MNRYAQPVWSAFLFLFLSPLPLHSLHAEESGKSLVQRADQHRFPEGDFSFQVSVTDLENGRVLRTTSYRVAARNTAADDDSLVETIAPERLVGRKLLMKGDDLWMITPDTRKPVRISLQQKLTGEVSNGDLSRTRFAEDYSAKVVGKESINQKPCLKLELSALNKKATYPKILYWISEKDSVPVRATFHALSGKPLKNGEYLEPKKFGKETLITRFRITDALNPKRVSELKYTAFRPGKFDDSTFNKQSLAE